MSLPYRPFSSTARYRLAASFSAAMRGFCVRAKYRSRISVQLILTDIRRSEVLPLCARLLAGRLPEYGEAADILPARPDFALLWRYLSSRGGALRCTLEELPGMLAPTGLHPAMA